MNPHIEQIYNYLEQNDPQRLQEIRQIESEDTDRGKTQLTLIQQELTNQKTTLPTPITQDKQYLRNLEDTHNDDGIKYINKIINIHTSKTLSKYLLTTNQTLTFLISKEKIITGKITNQISQFKEKIPIAAHAEFKQTGITEYLSFGETWDKKIFKIQKILHGEFYRYQFQTKTRQYILLSEEKLESKDYEIEGMSIELEDFPLIGNTLRFITKLPIIFVNKAKTKIPLINNLTELEKILKKHKITPEKWNNWLFTHPEKNKSYRHPELFEKLINAFLLSAKQEYHLHLLIISKKGTGKSTLEECIWHKFNESQDIIGGGQSTMKALIPSFRTNPPSAGAFINASKIVIVDEFLRILMSVEKEDREHQLSRLNDLLENRKRIFQSGNGIINGRMTSKFFGVSNPVWGTNSMPVLLEYIDDSFISRLLIWYQEEEHIKFVREEKGLMKPSFFMDNYMFLGIFDFCQSFVSKYDDVRVRQVFESCRGLFSGRSCFDRSLDTFDARYLHHARCLLDGLVKYRCISTGSLCFEAIEQDYVVLKCILEVMIVNWGIHI